MASRIELFPVTVAAGTAIATPATTALPFNDGVVSELVITVPPGPSGLVGFRILYGAQSVIPYTGANWVIADSRVIDWRLDGFPTGSQWQIQAYNLDVFAHTLYLEFMVDEVPQSPVAPIPLLPIGQ